MRTKEGLLVHTRFLLHVQTLHSHSSVFNNAPLVHLLSNAMNHKHDVRGLRGSVLRGGLLHIAPMEPCAAAGGWNTNEDEQPFTLHDHMTTVYTREL